MAEKIEWADPDKLKISKEDCDFIKHMKKIQYHFYISLVKSPPPLCVIDSIVSIKADRSG